jgi:hypothetical protein
MAVAAVTLMLITHIFERQQHPSITNSQSRMIEFTLSPITATAKPDDSRMAGGRGTVTVSEKTNQREVDQETRSSNTRQNSFLGLSEVSACLRPKKFNLGG